MNYFKDNNWLFNKFCVELLSDTKIAEICKTKKETIRYYRKKFNISKQDKIRKCRKCGNTKLRKNSGLICDKCHYTDQHNKFLKKSIEERRKIQNKNNKIYRNNLINSSLERQIIVWCKRHAWNKKLDFNILYQLSQKAVKNFSYINFSPISNQNGEAVKGIKYDKSNQASVDKIDHRLGYIKNNVQVIPYWLNAAKQQMNMQELINKMKHCIKLYV